MSAAESSGARAAAHAWLLRVRAGSEHMDFSPGNTPELDALDGRERGLAFELVTGTVKRRNSLDAVLDRFSKTSVKRTPAAVREALRLGAFQLLYLDRVPAHAAVDESVSLVSRAGKPTRGYVNAVLRKVASDGKAALADLTTGETTAALALRHSHPEWMVKLLVDELGADEAEAMLAAGNRAPERCLRVNPAAGDDLPGLLAADGVETSAAPLVAGALLYDGAPLQTSRAFRDGLVTPQSQGSQLAGLAALGGAPAATDVADLCAAPGTKTSQLALALPGARVVALDSDPRRVDAMRANLARQHVENAEVVLGDALAPFGDERRFALVLVDAPCTGFGTLASRPDLRWRRKPADVARLAKLQCALVRRAGELAAPGAAVTYAVCTITRAETLGVLDEVLADGGWLLDDLGAEFPQAAHPRHAACLLTSPSRHGTSGFFVARLRREGASG